MKEKAIICIILLLMAYAVCGCEDEPIKEAETGKYIREICEQRGVDYYWLPSGWRKIQWEGVEVNEPNEANYKAFFGWE